MIASVHLADAGARSALSILRRPPDPRTVPGLRHVDAALAAPLRGSVRPAPDIRRVALVAFWDDDAALDAYLADHAVAATMADGWHLRLEPLRAFGTWPGLPDGVPTSRTVEHQGPAAVLTLGRLRLSQTVRFLRTSAKAEAAVGAAPGLAWATGLGRPPFVGTCSLWHTTEALSAYAYGREIPAHPDAITANRVKPFHHQSAFIRFRPYGSHGRLDGRNPLSEDWMSTP